MSNTLSREITSTLVKDEASFKKLKSIWNDAVQQHKESRLGYDLPTLGIIYSLLRGKDWRQGFSEITNENKLQNGRTPFDTRDEAIRKLQSPSMLARYIQPFSKVLTADAKEKIAELLPKYSDTEYAYRVKVAA